MLTSEWERGRAQGFEETDSTSGPFLSVFLGIIAAHRLDQDGMVG